MRTVKITPSMLNATYRVVTIEKAIMPGFIVELQLLTGTDIEGKQERYFYHDSFIEKI